MTMPKVYQPIADRVLIKIPPKEQVSAGGIVIPETADQGKPQRGIVAAVGPGRTLESGEVTPMTVSVGDEVLFGAWAGVPIQLNGVEFLVVTHDDLLLGVVEEQGKQPEHEPIEFATASAEGTNHAHDAGS